MSADPLGKAILDYQRGELRGDCQYRDGADSQDGHIHENYFTPSEEWSDEWKSRLNSLDYPIVDIGCGSGQYAEFLQKSGEVVAIDVSPGAVKAAAERGVEDARVMDMFELEFSRDRFQSALVNGTQIGLAQSLAGARDFLSDLARITDEDGVAIVDNYEPTEFDPERFFGYRSDPRRGVAHRTFHVEYVRDGEREVGRNLHFVIFSPERLQDVTVGTRWYVAEVHTDGVYYRSVLRKPARKRDENEGEQNRDNT
ncbi:Methyltransferase domain-containing protein [Haladaptatus litoreus]|uniref:Methyltransferase domain-containing protein n=1 Tax=Haladaptatus litoreus TaxID=553468 RepID=A0A1N7BWZ4_9EURY|nr:class I SAM-dependent methyltransferase [Haladaptatus litoreus]SIR55859.1 Methyltransferase domain-containing protein [Haladaptatus litoreus]